MLTAEQMPRSVALPIAEELANMWWNEYGIDDSPEARAELVDAFMEEAQEIAAAAINAWPGLGREWREHVTFTSQYGERILYVVLPLPKEPRE